MKSLSDANMVLRKQFRPNLGMVKSPGESGGNIFFIILSNKARGNKKQLL
jgi:hypothetical protein